jgi:hypothetical protein
MEDIWRENEEDKDFANIIRELPADLFADK